MEIVEPVAYTEVRRVYLRDHPAERAHEANTNRDGEENLRRAEDLLGTWWRVRLTEEEALGVMLPWHLSEGGGYELVPRSGLTVGQAVRRLREDRDRIAELNPVCTEKLELMGRSPATPVYLSTRPVDHVDYEGLRVRTALTHLDGLHRMLAWGLTGRLRREEGLEAYIAGDAGRARPHVPAEGGTAAATPHAPTGGSRT
ncbi:hypothetical protein J0910_13835 [Nocardiopsis sp. CNT-189]|uniref:DUF6309 family protein n=1 Tax=Nocardiopsis oceanisediminis TaxID=2816862 RepID=UPI003B347BD3